MKSKWLLTSLMAIALSFISLNMTGCKPSATSESSPQAVKYTCPMHPEVVKDAPGNCPKCGMKLVEKR